MKNIAGNLGVAIAGIAGFILTVAVVVLVDHFLHFNIFALSFWVFIPAGALICGAAAASGYYFGSLFFQTRPTWATLVQILVVAAVCQVAIYYSEYRLMDLGDGRMASDVISFLGYMDVYFENQHMKFGRAMQIDAGATGKTFGYVLAVIDFVGFIIGGVFVFISLRTHPVCEHCGRYLRTLIQRKQFFAAQPEFEQFYGALFDVPVDGPDFQALLDLQTSDGKKLVQGNIMSTSTLRGCPHCYSQRVTQDIKVMNKKELRDVPTLTRNLLIPIGVDLRPVFRAAIERSKIKKTSGTTAA